MSKAVRDLCVFSRHDLASNPPFARMDLLSCRNVLIYLGAPLQQKLIPLFHYALKPAGFLMMGTAETVGGFGDLFKLVDRKHKIYAKKPGGKQPPFFRFTAPHPAEASVTEGFRKPPAPRTDFERRKEAADLIILNRYAPACVLVNENMEILHFRGHTGPYLEPAPGAASLNLFRMAREGLLVGLQTAMRSARKKNAPRRSEGLRVEFNGGEKFVNIQVIPIRSPGTKERNFLVLFEEAAGKMLPPEQTRPRRGRSEDKDSVQRVVQLKQELAATKAYLQSVIEDQDAGNQELRSLNEESLSTNEELQSTTEELETSNEELESANEELTTLNEELLNRNAQLTQANNDIQNFLASMKMAIVFVDRDLRIRRITPTAEKVLHLTSSDTGRPLKDTRLQVEIPDLEHRLLDAINSAKVKTQEIQDRDGHWFLLQTRPYITGENKVEGAILALTDIHELSERTQELAEANRQLRQELAMRQQAEEQVRGGEERIRLIADSLDAADDRGRTVPSVCRICPRCHDYCGHQRRDRPGEPAGQNSYSATREPRCLAGNTRCWCPRACVRSMLLFALNT